jgi:beta-lactamase regulating signal transducer with metallopeptidase domain
MPMRTFNQLVLTALFNACWQIPLLVGMASCSAWLLKDASARYRHWLWTSTLLLALVIPAAGAMPILFENSVPLVPPVSLDPATESLVHSTQAGWSVPAAVNQSSWSFRLNQYLVIGFLIFYCGILIYKMLALLNAARATVRIRQTATKLTDNSALDEIIKSCQRAVGERANHVEIRQSDRIHVPITFGFIRPIIVLPDQLIRGGSRELITSAIGHEIVHVARRDYALNLFYEFLYLPLSFNPAAAVIRRRIKQTRELCCDEIVAERILSAETYARSLVKLASSAPPLSRLSFSTTVGIADADILEARIMSLLRRPKLNVRRKKLLLTAISLLLFVPCIAAASFAMRVDVNSAGQDPSQQDKEQKEKERREKELTGEIRIMRLSTGEKRGLATADETDPQVREEMERRREIELAASEKAHNALLRLAKVPMEQALQIATSQAPGKVLECSLIGARWKEPGKLADDELVLYRVVIVSGDDNAPGTTRVFVNAIDGSVYKVERELPRKKRSEGSVNP